MLRYLKHISWFVLFLFLVVNQVLPYNNVYATNFGEKKENKTKKKDKKNKKTIKLSKVEIRQQDSLLLEAIHYGISDKFQQAKEVYLKILETDPYSFVAYFQLSKISASENMFADAVSYGEKARDIEPENEWINLNLADLYKRSRAYNKVVEVYEDLYRLYPRKLEYAYECSNAYLHLGDLLSAIKVYDYLEERFGVNDLWTMQKYKLYISLRDKEAARQEILNATYSIPGEIKYYEILAQTAMDSKEYDSAYKYYNKILELEPGNTYIHISLADYYRKRGDIQNSLESLEKAVANRDLDFTTKTDVLAAYYISTAAYLKNVSKDQRYYMFKQADTLFRLLIKVHPYEANAYYMYGKYTISHNNYAKAKELFLKALSLDKASFSIWDMLLQSLNLGNFKDELLKYGLKAKEIFPEQLAIDIYPSLYYYENKNFEKALEYVNPMLEKSYLLNSYVKMFALQIQGDSYFELKQIDKACEVYDQLLLIATDKSLIYNNYAYYLALANRDIDKAEQLSKKSLVDNANNISYLDTYAFILFKLGRYKESLEYIERIFSLEWEESSVIYEHYGDILFKLNRKVEAVEQWEKAFNLIDKSDDRYDMLNQKIKAEKWIDG